MAEYGKSKSSLENTITSLTQERDGLSAQLSQANTTIQSYKDMDIEAIQQSAKDWETRYTTDTQDLKDQLEATRYGYAVEQATAGMKFTSESAKKTFVADLTGKKLPLENGRLLGLEDFTKSYKETDPGAFASENVPPTFTMGGSKQPADSDSALRSAFGLTAKGGN
jgi:hypothetical protein